MDIWALGVLIFTMLFGTQPFKSKRILKVDVNMESEIRKKCENGFNMNAIKGIKNESISEEEEQVLR